MELRRIMVTKYDQYDEIESIDFVDAYVVTTAEDLSTMFAEKLAANEAAAVAEVA